jgi:hypothetical protein
MLSTVSIPNIAYTTWGHNTLQAAKKATASLEEKLKKIFIP